MDAFFQCAGFSLTEEMARLGFAPALIVGQRGLGYASSDLFRIGRLCR